MSDQRIIVDDERKLLLVTNCKAGFSTCHKEITENPSFATRNIKLLPDLPNPDEYHKILFWRDPYERFVSFLNDKLILLRGNQAQTFRWISRVTPPGYVRGYLADRREGRRDRVVDLLSYLSPFIDKGGHARPQHMILTQSNLRIDFSDEVLPVERNIEVLKHYYGPRIRPYNVTGSGDIFTSNQAVSRSYCISVMSGLRSTMLYNVHTTWPVKVKGLLRGYFYGA